MGKYEWSQLTTLQVGKYAEYFVKMEFTLHGFDVYTSEVDDKGVDFVVCDDSREHYYDVQVKSVRNLNYIFFRKEYFVLRENLLAAVVMLADSKPPELYLIPSNVWLQPNSLFVSRDYGPPKKSKPEWGLNLSQRNYPLLAAFSFDKTVDSLRRSSLNRPAF